MKGRRGRRRRSVIMITSFETDIASEAIKGWIGWMEISGWGDVRYRAAYAANKEEEEGKGKRSENNPKK